MLTRVRSTTPPHGTGDSTRPVPIGGGDYHDGLATDPRLHDLGNDATPIEGATYVASVSEGKPRFRLDARHHRPIRANSENIIEIRCCTLNDAKMVLKTQE